MTLKSCKYVLVACLFGLVPLADRVHADPVNVPGMQRDQPGEYPIGVNDYFGCGGLVTNVWIVLISHEESIEIGKGLDNHFGSSNARKGDLASDAITKIHERVSKIDSREHPDALLRLHTAQHLAEECVLANGEVPPYRNETGRLVTYDGFGDQPLRTAQCDDFDTTRAVILDCAEKAIDAINDRHDWNVTFQRNE